ncbi:tubby C-terminal domain-like protein [Aquibacillus rhizosphaerae]|uniref:Tubby C-terminal domain-containing protein n=1 Tax=Aquibacillus rhizosphaerae TaxID=3051431 RepID=A0ABT7L0S6_9BACI|nr:hypothetical protein [Aquibacillus sp. LR5S19]MDL4839442.1 hypothetical protein [Aquibacillus sp. LR5S19]
MFIHYKRGLKSSKKPVDIYQGRLKIGEIQRTYRNSFIYWLDTIALDAEWFISYKIINKDGNLKFQSKETSSFFSRTQFDITYSDSDDQQHELILKQKKGIGVKNFKFKYKDNTYLVQKYPFEPTQILYNNLTVAECKTTIADRTTTIQLYGDDFKVEPLLIVGIYHSAFFIQRG